MIPPSYTNIYTAATKRPEYLDVRPDEAIAKLKDFPYLPGTYLISQGEGFCELLFTFVHRDRIIYQLIAKLIWNNSKYSWDFNCRTFTSINELILNSKLFGFCFLLFAYTPLLKMEGFVPLDLTHEIAFSLFKEGKEGDYFVTNDMETTPNKIKIFRYSRESNGWDMYSLTVKGKISKIPRKYKDRFVLKRAATLQDSAYKEEIFVTNNLLRLAPKKP